MEAIIDTAVADGTKIDAILAENDSTALGVVGALTAKTYGYPPLSGQDGDPANLNNVALGKQYVDVWKNANELGKPAAAAALALCNGGQMASLKLPDGLIDPTVAPTAGSRPSRSRRRVATPSARSSSSRPRSPRTTSRGDRRRPDHQGRALQGRRRRDGAGGLQVAASAGEHSPAPPGTPGAQVASAPRSRRAAVANVADVAPVSGQRRPSRLLGPRYAASSRRRRSISGCSACSSPSS